MTLSQTKEETPVVLNKSPKALLGPLRCGPIKNDVVLPVFPLLLLLILLLRPQGLERGTWRLSIWPRLLKNYGAMNDNMVQYFVITTNPTKAGILVPGGRLVRFPLVVPLDTLVVPSPSWLLLLTSSKIMVIITSSISRPRGRYYCRFHPLYLLPHYFPLLLLVSSPGTRQDHDQTRLGQDQSRSGEDQARRA